MSDNDRGAHMRLTFSRCQRGFTLQAADPTRNYLFPPTFAFDRVEDVAAWLVEQYGQAPECPRADGWQAPKENADG